MNAEASSDHAQSRRAITAHFAGTIAPAAESAMRAHLPTCLACRRHYDRHLLLARLDPRGRSAQQRLGAGLGFRTAPGPGRTWWGKPRRQWLAGLAVACVALALMVAARWFPFR